MPTNLELLEAEALKLTTAERAHLTERLIQSLDADDANEAAWSAEIEKRLREIDEGEVETRPVEDVLAELHAKYG